MTKSPKQEVTNEQESGQCATKELTVCDIIGEWGAYQLSVTLFGIIYSAILSITVVVGPMWTPEMRHICVPAGPQTALGDNATGISFRLADFASDPHECNQTVTSDSMDNQVVECERYIYDAEHYGQMLTNTFDLVCNRQWLRSTLSSAALTGMLISSVTLGLLSDRYGRMRCIQVGFVISIVANIGTILVESYLLLNVCFMLMSLAQVGVANALSTLVMEATSPRYRFVSVFEYGFGWGLGLLIVPLLNSLTRNYKHFLLVILGCQFVMMVWCRLGVFESIRWLLSEGRINRAQIELQRACHWNRVKNGADLAQKIASVQVSQVRKASQLIEAKVGSQEDLLLQAIRRSFLLDAPDTNRKLSTDDSRLVGHFGPIKLSISECSNISPIESENQGSPKQSQNVAGSNGVLSPTLARKSFSINNDQLDEMELVDLGTKGDEKSEDSTTDCALVQLVLQYSKTLHEQEEGSFFLTRMFHRKLYKTTIILSIISIMLETAYYGLIQASGIVGSDIDFNYIVGALSEWLAAIIYVLTLWLLSRRAALIVPISLSSLACLGMALSYYLTSKMPSNVLILLNQTIPLNQSATNSGQITLSETTITDQSVFNVTNVPSDVNYNELLIEFREQLNVGLMTFGKLTITVGIQIAATITMESYPNNLRQSGAGAILFVGRTCSIVAPFLFRDHSKEKVMFQIILTVLGSFGFLVCILVPMLLRETKDQELCDRLNDISQEEEDDDDTAHDRRN